MRSTLINQLFALILTIFFKLVNSQISTTINYLDKSYENEPFYYDLSFLNSNFNNHESVQNKFSLRERSGLSTTKHSCNNIKQIPSSIRSDLKLSYFYQKYTEAYGIPVIGSNKVSINGLKRACYVLRFYLASSSKIRETFYKKNLRVVVLATSENILSVPEYNSLPSSWYSVRGLSPTSNIPLLTVSEENLQCSNDKYKTEDLIVHQLSYALLSLDGLEPNLKLKLEDSYQRARTHVPWKNTFSLFDIKEYLASGIDIYLNSFGKKESFTFTYDDMRKNDYILLSIIQQIFPCDNPYLNKCKSTRENENNQILKLGDSCEPEVTSNSIQASNFKLSPTQIITEPTKTTQKTITSSFTNRFTTQTYTTDYSSNTLSKVLSRVTQANPTTTSTSTTTTTTFKQIEQFFTSKDCVNLNENCALWSAKGECNRNRQYMSLECKKSCGLCDSTTHRTTKSHLTTKVDLSVFENFCKDDFNHCPIFALRGDCKLNPHYMLQRCMRSCNLCGDLVEQKDRIQPISKKTLIRRPSITHPNNDSKGYKNFFSSSTSTTSASSVTNEQSDVSCQDLVDYCNDLAERGDCSSNQESMKYYCPKSCNLC